MDGSQPNAQNMDVVAQIYRLIAFRFDVSRRCSTTIRIFHSCLNVSSHYLLRPFQFYSLLNKKCVCSECKINDIELQSDIFIREKFLYLNEMSMKEDKQYNELDRRF